MLIEDEDEKEDRSMVLGLVQLNPIFKKPLDTLNQANQLISSLSPGDIDLMVLPELAFTGYDFKSFEEIEEFIESEEDGISVRWGKQTAQRLDCHVMVGYAQKINTEEKKCYNALAIISNQGELITTYHKTQLYPPVDPLWAKAGDGFLSLDLKIGRRNNQRGDNVKCTIGICMDLSPDKFEAPFEAYELSRFAIKNQTEILICSMAWLYSTEGKIDPDRTNDGKSWNEVCDNLNYWATRCEPMWNKNRNQTFIAANRVGIENQNVFTGTSCVLSNVDSKDHDLPKVLGYASKHQPELLIVKIPLSNQQ